MKGYRAFEETVSMLRRYGREVARLLNQEHKDSNVLRYQVSQVSTIRAQEEGLQEA